MKTKQQTSQFVRYCVRPITRGALVGLGLTAGLAVLNAVLIPSQIVSIIVSIPNMIVWFGGLGVAIGAAVGLISYLMQPNDPTAKTLRKVIKWTVLGMTGILFLMLLPTLFVASNQRRY